MKSLLSLNRLYQRDIEGIIALKSFQDKIELDSLYLDSTFLSTDYTHFPKQMESVQTIIKLAEDWLAINPKNIIILRPPAAYGYEFLLVELAQHFKFKIHVTSATFNDYLYIPHFDSYISNNRYHCGRIHLCSTNMTNWQLKKCPCLSTLHERHISIIRPTAMKWKHLNAHDQHYEMYNDMANIYSVCYSNHSSYDEIKFLIQYLRPKTVKLNVVPKNVCQRNEMYSILDGICTEYQPNDQDDQMEIEDEVPETYDFIKIISDNKRRSMALAKDDVSQLKIKKRRKC